MRNAPQTGFNAANNDGDIAIGFLQPLAVDRNGPVRALARYVAGCVGVIIATLPVSGVVVNHGVHVSRRDAEEKVGPAERGEGFSRCQSGCAIMPTRNPCASNTRPMTAMPKLG